MRSLFLALWPDARVRAGLHARARALQSQWGGRASRPEGYHLTLHFLGRFDALPEDLLRQVRAVAASVEMAGFTLQVDRAGAFGGGNVGWLGCSRVPPGLEALWKALAPSLPASARRDRFVPHVTVLRRVQPTPGIEVGPLPWRVDGVRLLASAPPGDPVVYETLDAWPLRADA